MYDHLTSLKFAGSVVAALVLSSAAGTLTGRTQIFSSWWFMSLLGLLAVSVAASSGKRFQIYRDATGDAQRRALGSIVTQVGILFILAGAVIRGVWGVTLADPLATLPVVNDPGVPVVFAGFSLVIVGVTILFAINPWLTARADRPNNLSRSFISGWTNAERGEALLEMNKPQIDGRKSHEKSSSSIHHPCDDGGEIMGGRRYRGLAT